MTERDHTQRGCAREARWLPALGAASPAAVLAQAPGPPGLPGSGAASEAAAQLYGVGVVSVILFGLGAILLTGLYVLAIFALFDVARRLPEREQPMTPGLVWLLLIPFFNLVWMWYVVIKLSGAYRDHFASRGNREENGGLGIGLGFLITWIGSIVLGFVGALLLQGGLSMITTFYALQGISGLLGLASLALFVTYLVKMYTLAGQLGAQGGRTGEPAGGRRGTGTRPVGGATGPQPGAGAPPPPPGGAGAGGGPTTRSGPRGGGTMTERDGGGGPNKTQAIPAPGAARGGGARLVVVSGRDVDNEYNLALHDFQGNPARNTIGSHANCAVPIKGDPTVSAEHAEIRLENGHLCLFNLAATNPTIICRGLDNRIDVKGRAFLRDRDRIWVGSTELQLLQSTFEPEDAR